MIFYTKMFLNRRTVYGCFCRKSHIWSGFSWFRRSNEIYDNVIDGLKETYKRKLLPLEEEHFFHDFHSPKLNDPDFEAKPLVLFMGQYSTGKTTLIRHILQSDFPGMRIGPEPTTDRFMAIMHGVKLGVIPGNALVVDPSKPFAPLAKHGNAFLTKFQCSTVPSSILQGLSLIDTPGILSGEKQRVDRGYDFTGVLEWFAERVDRIVLLFDAHKLDISDEFRRSIEALRGNDEKIRIVLNKSDMVDHQSLMRVYGSLMWSLGKVLKTPEVARVYVGSFWDQPLRFSVNKQLFEDEEQDLLTDIQSLPVDSALRKLNDLSKRARLALVHAYIMDALKQKMPVMFGVEAKKRELIDNLKDTYETLQQNLGISPGDFPDITKMQQLLTSFDFKNLNKIEPSLIASVNGMLAQDITKLMSLIPQDTNMEKRGDIEGGVFGRVTDTSTPFGYKQGEGFDAGRKESSWIVGEDRASSDALFLSFNTEEGKLPRKIAKAHLEKSALPRGVLGNIYSLADCDDDGLLDKDEFALANYIVSLKLAGFELPSELPSHLVPPSKRL